MDFFKLPREISANLVFRARVAFRYRAPHAFNTLRVGGIARRDVQSDAGVAGEIGVLSEASGKLSRCAALHSGRVNLAAIPATQDEA